MREEQTGDNFKRVSVLDYSEKKGIKKPNDPIVIATCWYYLGLVISIPLVCYTLVETTHRSIDDDDAWAYLVVMPMINVFIALFLLIPMAVLRSANSRWAKPSEIRHRSPLVYMGFALVTEFLVIGSMQAQSGFLIVLTIIIVPVIFGFVIAQTSLVKTTN